MQVRLNGEGDVGSDGGGSGNLYVSVGVQEHNLFQRDGTDIVYTLPLNIAEATLGVEKVIPTVDGFEEDLKLPQGTQPGAEFRIRNKGVPHLHSNRRGDMRVQVDVRVPGSLNTHQRELMEELARSFNGDGPAKSRNGKGRKRSKKKAEEEPTQGELGSDDSVDKGIFDRIKDAF
jgi:molecular chaperone DnaJ